jgi:dihydrofolate reductase
MRKLILEEWVSLDGYAADKNGELNFFPSTEENKYSDSDQLAFLESIDTILLGRATYQLFAGFWPTASTDKEIIADRLNGLPKLVFSNSLTEAPWGNWPAARVVRGDAVTAVEKMKADAGKDMVLWGSISLAQSLIRADLIDEYHIQVCPTFLGSGRPLFPDLEGYGKLKLVDTRKYDTGVMFLKYRPGTRLR